MASRTWIKIYCDKWLNGTLRDETPEFRGIWVDLLVLAGSGKYGDSGEIKITDHVGFFDTQLADLLQISRQKWATMKQKLIHSDRIIIKNGNIIAIKNWAKYQSEYDRQRQYHHLEPTSESSPEKCKKILQANLTTETTTGEGDKRLEKEIIEEDKEETKQEESFVQFLPPEQIERIKEIREQKLKEVIELYQDRILGGATIPEGMEKELRVACRRYSTFWVSDAIEEADAQGHPDWGYIVGILRNWSKEGKKTH
jgi:hypothetical protein